VSSSRNRAFTLVELLVAMAIGTLIVGACFAAFRTVLDAREKLAVRSALVTQGRAAVDEIAAAVRSAIAVEGIETPFFGEDRDSDALPDDRLTFFTVSDRNARRDDLESDIYEVSFYIVRDEETGRGVLARRKDPGVDDDITDGGILTEIALDVVALEMSYYDGLLWVDAWPGELDEGVPSAVRVSMTLADPDYPKAAVSCETTVTPLVTSGVATDDE